MFRGICGKIKVVIREVRQLGKKTYSSETIRTVKTLVPMDDVMFQKMCEDKATCQELISTILGEAVTVVDVIPQDFIMNLQGRSVRLDCLCKLSDGTFVNVEVQKSDNEDHESRVRYNASVVTANETPKSTKFKDVARVIVIYITKFDIFEDNLPIYHIDRVVRETQKVRTDGFTEIYVNAEVRNHDTELNGNVTDLMSLFTNRDKFDYEKYPNFSKRKNTFTNTEKGENEMCEKVDSLIKQTRMFDLFGYVQRGTMTIKNAALEASLPTKEFKAEMLKYGYTLPTRTRKPAQSVQ